MRIYLDVSPLFLPLSLFLLIRTKYASVIELGEFRAELTPDLTNADV